MQYLLLNKLDYGIDISHQFTCSSVDVGVWKLRWSLVKLAGKLNTRPIAALYNAIFVVVYSLCKYYNYGYIEKKYNCKQKFGQ